MRYIKSLDGLRALAILLVMLFHFYGVLEIGWIGVQMFFVLSGYLITNILLHSKTDTELSPYLKRFYWRRTLRIFPVYYLYLLAVSGIYLLFNTPADFPEAAPYLYTYTFNLKPLFAELRFDAFFTHFWSLCVEEQFYLIWPLVIYLLSAGQLKKLIYLLILGVPIFRFFLGDWLIDQNYEEVGEVLYRFTFSHFDAFAWGGAIAIFRLDEKVTAPGRLLVASLLLVLAAGLLHLSTLGEAVGLSSLGYPIGGMQNYQHVWSFTLLSFFSMAFIIYLIARDGTSRSLLVRIFRHPVMVQIGKVSYGMYVYHWVVLAFYQRHIHPLIQNLSLSFLIYLVMVYLLSWLSFHTVEKLFLQLKDRKFQSNSVAVKG